MGAVWAAASLVAVQAEAQSVASSSISRKIEVVAKRTSPVRGLTATGLINVNGTLFGDSYDSEAGPYSATNANENCFLGTTSKASGDFIVGGTADIIGQIGTGAPGVLKIQGGGDASVGSKPYVAAGYTGVEAGCLQDDLNVSIDGVTLPFDPATASPAPSPVYNLLSPVSVLPLAYITNFTFGTGNYVATDFVLRKYQIATITGDAVFSVRNFQLEGGTLIVETNASFNVYFSRSARFNSGSATNKTLSPIKLSFYGLPTADAIVLNGMQLHAYFYAPTATLTLNGSAELFGASITQNINAGGNAKFHYDEALLRQNYRFVPIAWKELY